MNPKKGVRGLAPKEEKGGRKRKERKKTSAKKKMIVIPLSFFPKELESPQ